MSANHLHGVTIPPYVIEKIAEAIYGKVDVFEYQDDGYMLKDVELAVEGWLTQVATNVCEKAESLVLDSNYPALEVRHHCDMDGCTMPVRVVGDIYCHWHGAQEDRLQAEVERITAVRHDDLPF